MFENTVRQNYVEWTTPLIFALTRVSVIRKSGSRCQCYVDFQTHRKRADTGAMRGQCAFTECDVEAHEELSTSPCSMCSKPVHHMCSNMLYEGELSIRVCSMQCSVEAAGRGKPPSASAPSSTGPTKPRIQSMLKAPVSKKSSKKRAPTPTATVVEEARSPESDDDAEGGELKSQGRTKFFFTAKADLALLKEVLNVQPYVAGHGQKREKWGTVTDNLNEHLGTSLRVRTVQDRVGLLVKEYTAGEAKQRRKSGVQEDYDERQQLLCDITTQVRDEKGKKEDAKGKKKARQEKLVTYGAQLREEGRKRQCKRLSTSSSSSGGNDGADRSANAENLDPSTDGAHAKPAPAKSSAPAALSNTQVNAVIAEYLAVRADAQKDDQDQEDRDLEFKREKAIKEEERWRQSFDFKREQAEETARKWAEEVALRREEMELRREELTLLRMQMEMHSRLRDPRS